MASYATCLDRPCLNKHRADDIAAIRPVQPYPHEPIMLFLLFKPQEILSDHGYVRR